MSNLTVFGSANLPSVGSLVAALGNLTSGVSSSNGSVILKMDKTGHWVFGADQTEVEADSTWAINPFSFVKGFIAWGEGEVLGEKMVPSTEPLPEMDAAPAGAKRGWEPQLGMSLKCVSGEDKDMEVRYTVTSVGGIKAVVALGLLIGAQIEKDQTKPVPVVSLKKEHYIHKSYGRIHTPKFHILEWIGMDGDSTEADAPPVADAPAEAPADPRRRRRA